MGPEAHEGMPPTTLRDALATRIQRVANQPVTAADFELDRVPGHLQVSFRAVDERGRAVGSGRDLAELQERFSDRARASVAKSLSRTPGERGLTQKPDSSGARSARSAARSRHHTTRGPDRLGLRRPSRGRRQQGRRRRRPRLPGARRRGRHGRAARRGDARGCRSAPPARACAGSCCWRSPSPAAYVLEHLTSAEKLALAASPYPSAKALVEDAAWRWRMPSSRAPRPGAVVRTRAEFERVRDASVGRRRRRDSSRPCRSPPASSRRPVRSTAHCARRTR